MSFLTELKTKAKDTEYEHLVFELADNIKLSYERLKEINNCLLVKKDKNERAINFISTIKKENLEDVRLIENWLKSNTYKATNDSDFYNSYYSKIKEAFLEFVDRDEYLLGIIERLKKVEL